MLAASVPLLASTAGCLGGGTPDVTLFNRVEREVWVRLTIERESDGKPVFQRAIELPTVGEDVETFPSPVDEPSAEHTMHVLVKNGPEATERFSETLSEPFSPGIKGVFVRVEMDGIEFGQVVS